MAHGWFFLIFYLIVSAGLSALSYYNLWRWAHYSSRPLSRSATWLVFTLPLSFPLVNLLTTLWPHPLTQYLYTLVATLVGLDFIIFSWLIIVDLGHFCFHWSPRLSRIIIVSGSSLLALLAVFQGQLLTTKTIELTSPYLTKPLRLVQISDIHLGAVRREGWLRTVVDMIKTEQPDAVVITGDLLDGTDHVTPALLAPLNDLKVPIFFVPGNHDYYAGWENIKKVLRENTPVTILEDQLFTWNGIQIIGLTEPTGDRYVNAASTIHQLNPTPERFTILLSHQPLDPSLLKIPDLSLILAGHTHAGEIIPFNFLVRWVFPYYVGFISDGHTAAYVSPGTGTWGPPLRLGTNNEITIWELKPSVKP